MGISVFQRVYDILTEPGAKNEHALRKTASKLGTCSIEKVLPSLEDVFVTSTRRYM